MAGFSLSSGRNHAVGIASALALVLTCAGILGSAAASAASPTTVELTCGPEEPTAGSEVTCNTVVSSPGGAPEGDVHFLKFGFADLGSGTCRLVPISQLESRCAFRFRVNAPGRLVIAAIYAGNATHDRGSDELELRARPGGSIRVECSPEFGFPHEPSTCEAFVPNTPGVSQAPGGSVHFRSDLVFAEPTTGLIEPECSLEAVQAGGRCVVTFVPDSAIGVAIVADYEGDASHPAQFGSTIYVVNEEHETAISATCSPAPSILAPTTCTATVVNLDVTGGAPNGGVTFETEPDNGFFPQPGRGICGLEEVEDTKPTESSCRVRYQPTRPGPQRMRLRFDGTAIFQPTSSALDFEVIEPHTTATKLTCKPSHGTFAGICLASVTDTSPRPVPLSGTIRISGPSTVKVSLPTCTLLPGQSGCSFPYSMTTIGSATVFADYSGDNKGHLPSSDKAVASKQP